MTLFKTFYNSDEYDLLVISKAIYNERHKRKMTNIKFAEFLNVPQTSLNRYERCDCTKIPVHFVDTFCEKCNINKSDLLIPLKPLTLEEEIYEWSKSNEAIPYIRKAYMEFKNDKYSNTRKILLEQLK